MKLQRIVVKDGSVELVFGEGAGERPSIAAPVVDELKKPALTKAERGRAYREKKKREREEESSMPQGSLPTGMSSQFR